MANTSNDDFGAYSERPKEFYKTEIESIKKKIKHKKNVRIKTDEHTYKYFYDLAKNYYSLAEKTKIEGPSDQAHISESTKWYNHSLLAFEMLIQASEPSDINNKIKFDRDEILRRCTIIINNRSRFELEVVLRAFYCIGLIYYKTNIISKKFLFHDQYEENYNKAIDNFDKYLELSYKTGDYTNNKVWYTTLKVYYYKSKSFESLEDYHEAINCLFDMIGYMKKIDIGLGTFNAFFNLGHYHHLVERNNDAIFYLRNALLFLNTTYDNNHLIDYPFLQPFEEDIIFGSKNTAEYDYNDTLLMISLCYKKLGVTNRAETIYKKIIKEYENSNNSGDKKLLYRAKNNLAMLYAEANDITNALNEINFVTDFDKASMKAGHLDTKGYIHYRNEEYIEALKWFNRAIQDDPSDEEFWLHKGNSYLKLGRYNEAISSYDNARRGNAKFIQALNNRAVAHYKNNDKERAITDLKEILRIKYDDVMAHHNLLLLSNKESIQSDFLNYWHSTGQKKRISTALISTIIILSSVLFISPLLLDTIYKNPYNTTNTTEVTNTSEVLENTSITNIKTITNSSTPFYTNQYLITAYIVTLMLFVIILLSPIIKTAKLGTTSIELTIIDTTPDKKTELEFIE